MTSMADPPHVGGFIRREIVEARGLTVSEAAAALGIGRVALSALLNERQGLSPEMALRIEAAFGVRAETLLRMHHAWELSQARRRHAEIVRKVKPVPAE